MIMSGLLLLTLTGFCLADDGESPIANLTCGESPIANLTCGESPIANLTITPPNGTSAETNNGGGYLNILFNLIP